MEVWGVSSNAAFPTTHSNFLFSLSAVAKPLWRSEATISHHKQMYNRAPTLPWEWHKLMLVTICYTLQFEPMGRKPGAISPGVHSHPGDTHTPSSLWRCGRSDERRIEV